jgi:hypothetical protein
MTPNINQNKTFLYDSNVGAYFMDSYNNDEYACLMYNGGTMQSNHIGDYVRNINYTYICDVYITADYYMYESSYIYGGSDDFHNINGGTSSSRNSSGYVSREIWSRNSKSFNLNEWKFTVGQRNSDSFYAYKDVYNSNIRVIESGYATTWALVYNANMDTHVMFGACCAGCIKNAYAFNTCLDDSDIMTIYNHDHQ